MKSRRTPNGPTEREVLEHGNWHDLYRVWFLVCVAGRGLSGRHVIGELRRSVGTIFVDGHPTIFVTFKVSLLTRVDLFVWVCGLASKCLQLS